LFQRLQPERFSPDYNRGAAEEERLVSGNLPSQQRNPAQAVPGVHRLLQRQRQSRRHQHT